MTNFVIKSRTGSSMKGLSMASFPTGCMLPTKWPDQPLYAGRKAAGMSESELHIRDSRNIKHFSSGIPTPTSKQGLLILDESKETAYFIPMKRVYKMAASKMSASDNSSSSSTAAAAAASSNEPPKKKQSLGINLSKIRFGDKNNDDDDNNDNGKGTKNVIAKSIDGMDDDIPDITDCLSHNLDADDNDDDDDNKDAFLKQCRMEENKKFKKTVSKAVVRNIRDKERTNEDDDLIAQRINADEDEHDDCIDENDLDVARNPLGDMFQAEDEDDDDDDDDDDKNKNENEKKEDKKGDNDKKDAKNTSNTPSPAAGAATASTTTAASAAADDENKIFGVSISDIYQRLNYVKEISGGSLSFEDVRDKIKELTGITIGKEKFPEIRKKIGLKKKGKRYFLKE